MEKNELEIWRQQSMILCQETPKAASLALHRKVNEAHSIAHVCAAIQKAYIFCTPKTQLNDDGMVMVAREILKDFYYLKLGELEQAILNGSKGQYGEAYNNINGQTLYKWIKAFEVEKEEKAHDLRMRKHQQYKDKEKQGYSQEASDKLKKR